MSEKEENSMTGSASVKAWDYVRDYSRHKDINAYLESILGAAFCDYRLKWEKASKQLEIYDFPLFLVFEMMFKCNLRCIMCAHSSQDRKKYEYDDKLSVAAFTRIMKEAALHYCPSMTFGGMGEPLLDPDMLEMIALAKDSGFVDIMLNSNATLLTEDMSRKLIEAGLTRLRIGFDGFSARTYEKIRVGANFNEVKNNIINFIKIRDGMKNSLPVVRISYVSLSENDSEVKDFIRFWEPIVDYVSIQRYRPHELTEKRLNMRSSWKNSDKRGVCSQPFERLYIRGNGDVYGCCSIAVGPKVGSVMTSSIYDIWNSEAMRGLRSALKDDRWNDIPACRECLGKDLGF